MENLQSDRTMMCVFSKDDTIDIPDCFGEYKKSSKLCSTYCAIAIRCCILQNRNPKVDILEKLLEQNQFALKQN